MKTLIAADGTTLDSSVAKRFGHAPYYLCVDTDSRLVQVIKNVDHDDETHAIIPHMIQQGVDVFITGNIGPHAFELIKSLKRRVGLARNMSAAEAIEKLQQDELKILKTPTVKHSFHDHAHHTS